MQTPQQHQQQPLRHPHRIHPLVAAAAASVVLVSLVGVAAITGVLPDSHGTPAPAIAPSAYSQTNTVPPVAYAQLGGAPVAGAEAGTAQPPYTQPGHGQQAYAQQPAVTGATAGYADTLPAAPSQYVAASSAPYAAGGAQYAAVQQPRAVVAAPPVRTVETVRVAEAGKPRKVAETCHQCGTVIGVTAVEHVPERASGVGAGVGALVGGLLGNQIGGGHGRQLATVAGAVGGGVVGNQLERKSKRTVSYRIRVRMEDGHIRTFTRSTPGWQAGDRVRVVDGDLRARG